MNLFRSFALYCALLLPALSFAQDFKPQTAFRNLKALKGVWFMPTDRGDRLEIWQIEDDSTMSGRAVRIKTDDGDTITLETLTLALRDTNIIYSAIVRGQNNNKPVDFKLVEAYSDEFLFTNPKHDDPQKIRYILLGNRELQVTTESNKNGRVVTKEYIFEREFSPVAVEFRLRGGFNVSSLVGEKDFNGFAPKPDPAFGYLPGWDIGVATTLKGRGGFLGLNIELGMSGKYSQVTSEFSVLTSDTSFTTYVRDGSYRTTWLNIAVLPEYTFRRDGRLSAVVGPYYGRLLTNKVNGTEKPASDNKLFNSNKDLRKNDFGLVGGLQYKLNIGKKDIGGKIGLRASLGLVDLDNLYKLRCAPTSNLCNERVLMRGISAYYSINLAQL